VEGLLGKKETTHDEQEAKQYQKRQEGGEKTEECQEARGHETVDGDGVQARKGRCKLALQASRLL
jgi:hypothetical protein